MQAASTWHGLSVARNLVFDLPPGCFAVWGPDNPLPAEKARVVSIVVEHGGSPTEHFNAAGRPGQPATYYLVPNGER